MAPLISRCPSNRGVMGPRTVLDMVVRKNYNVPFVNRLQPTTSLSQIHRDRYRSRDSVVGIATSYGLDDRGVEEFSPLHLVQTGSGVHQMGTGGFLYPGIKRPEREADHSPAASSEVKKMWIYTSTPPCAFMA
jgi:hypothetical protein